MRQIATDSIPGRPPSRRPTIGPRVRVLLMLAAGLLAAAALAFALVQSGDGGRPAPPTEEIVPAASPTPGEELLALTPAAATRCREFDSDSEWFAEATASARCRSEGQRVYFYLFETESDLDAAYEKSLGGFPTEPDGPTCIDWPYAARWYRDDAAAGRVQCYVATDDLAGIDWTDEESLVYGVVEGADDDLSSVVDAWTALNPEGTMETRDAAAGEVAPEDTVSPPEDEEEPATEEYLEYAAIGTDIDTEVGAIAGTSISYVRFLARDDDGDGVVVGRVSGSASLDDDEFMTLPETPERRALVDRLRDRMAADGWTELGLVEGGEWFEYRFGR
jgi:hypothetical protein